MERARQQLAAYILDRREDILVTWEQEAVRVPGAERLPRAVLRDELARVLASLARDVQSEPADPIRATGSSAVGEHVAQRLEIGMPLRAAVSELLLLRDVIERQWPGADAPGGADALRALRAAVDRAALATVERFTQLRTRLLAAVDALVRNYPEKSLAETLQGTLTAFVRSVDGVGTAMILLREGDWLRVRAAAGIEDGTGFSVRMGEGFSGLVAAGRTPRTIRDARTDPEVLDPALRRSRVRALYGVPLMHGDELLGVAHMGTTTSPELSDEAKALFRGLMDRVAGVIYQEVLRERISAEQARYLSVVENAPTIIFSKGLDGRYVTMNRQALAPLGMTPEDFVGRTDYDVFPSEIADAILETDRQVLALRRAVEVEDRIVGTQGTRFFLVIKFPILDAEGRMLGIGGVATDVTERRRIGQGQQLLAEVGGVLASSSLDLDATLADLVRCVVPALADCSIIELLQEGGGTRRAVRHRDPGREELARALEGVGHAPEGPHLLQAALTTREPVLVPEVSEVYLDTIAGDAAHRRLLDELDPSSLIQVSLVARGRLLGAWGFVRCGASAPYDHVDVALARELGWRASLALDNAHLFAEAQEAARARDEVLGVVAHDLRGPLSSILIATRLAQSGRGPPALDEIARAAQQMKRLVSDLLDRQAIARGQLDVRPRPRPASELLRHAFEDLGPVAHAASLTLELSDPGDLPPVLGDADRVRQVFGNLVGNAAKFTPSGGRVTIGARREDDEVRFFVADTGPGFSAETLQHVFDRSFWKERRADRRSMGLGLTICKGIVEAHGGRIWAESPPGGGAKVWFTLPVEEAA